MQSFGATLKFDLHFFVFNWITQTILVAFSMKMSRACSGTLSSESDAFKFFKIAKNIKCTCITYIIVPGLVELFYLSNQFVVFQRHESNSSQRAVLYIFQNNEISMLVTFH